MAFIVKAVTFLVNVLQIMYGSKSVSPLDTHPKTMLLAISTFLLYCFACYLKQYISSISRSSTWPALLIYTNFRRFIGFISMVSFASIVFSTSSTCLAIVYLLLALFFTGKVVLSLIHNRNSIAMRRSNSSNLQDYRLTDLISMAEHGMVSIKSMEVNFSLGRMSEILDLEKGWGTNFGIGEPESKDGPQPESPKKVILAEKSFKELVWQARKVCKLEYELKRNHKECMNLRGEAPAKLGGEANAKKRLALPQKGIVINGVEKSGAQRIHDHQMASTKGKSKMVGKKLFNNNGLWSQEAIAALEKGKDMNKKLGKMVVNLEDKVIDNVSLADWLEKTTQDQFHQHGLTPHAEKKSQLEETSGPGVK